MSQNSEKIYFRYGHENCLIVAKSLRELEGKLTSR